MFLASCGIANYQQSPKPTHLVTFYSIPPGATVTLGGRVAGQTPITFPVVANKEKTLRTGVATLENISIRWQSGAQIQNTQVSFGIYSGVRQEFTFTRPKGIPGEQIDINYALQLQQEKENIRGQNLVIQRKERYCRQIATAAQMGRTQKPGESV